MQDDTQTDAGATPGTAPGSTSGTILVIGGSRGIGLATVKRGLAEGFRMRAFSRNPGDIEIADPRLERVEGDATNRDDVARAMEGATAVAITLGVPLNASTVKDGTTLFSAATETAVAAMKEAGVARLVAVTGIGSGDSWDTLSAVEKLGFKAVMGRIYADKTKQDQIIRDSGLDWTIVRPVILTNGGPGDYKVLRGPGEWRNGIVSRAKVADLIVTAIRDGAYIGEAPVIVG